MIRNLTEKCISNMDTDCGNFLEERELASNGHQLCYFFILQQRQSSKKKKIFIS